MNKVLSLANEKLLLQDQIQRDFINIAAHELRTPSQAILDYAEMLKVTPQKADYIMSIYNNAVRLRELIDDVLDATRIESNSLSMHKEPFYLNDLICDIVENYSTNIKITCENMNRIKVIADKTRIGRVITNLINNAIKFTPGGTITVNATEDRADKMS